MVEHKNLIIMRNFKFYLIASVALVAASCAPNALMMTGGEKLNEKITSAKTTVAVLPVVDWSEDEGFCKGYLLYGCVGAFNRIPAYNDVGLVVYIKSPEDAGFGMTPNYNLLYKAGEDVGADVLIIARVSKNTQTGVLPSNPLGTPLTFLGLTGLVAYLPTMAISAVYNYYRMGIKKVKTVYVVIHIMALDIKKHEVIAFGGFNKFNQIPVAEKDKAMQDYSAAMTFYAPMPDSEDLKKEFMANAGSWAGTQIANALLMEIGLSIPITFEFKYEYGDETWKSYPDGYFMKNYGLTPDEYKKLLKN